MMDQMKVEPVRHGKHHWVFSRFHKGCVIFQQMFRDRFLFFMLSRTMWVFSFKRKKIIFTIKNIVDKNTFFDFLKVIFSFSKNCYLLITHFYILIFYTIHAILPGNSNIRPATAILGNMKYHSIHKIKNISTYLLPLFIKYVYFLHFDFDKNNSV